MDSYFIDLLGKNRNRKKICIIGEKNEDYVMDIIKKMSNEDALYIFDSATKEKKIKEKARMFLENVDKKIKFYANSNKKYDTYAWNVSNFITFCQKNGLDSNIFDYIFYNGKHLFHQDIGIFAFIEYLLNDNGYIIISDCKWSIKNSPTMKPDINKDTEKNYSIKQIEIEQINYLIEIFLKNNTKFEEIESSSSNKNVRAFRIKNQQKVDDREMYY